VRVPRCIAFALAAAVLLVAPRAMGDADRTPLAAATLHDAIGARVPRTLRFVDQAGRALVLDQAFGGPPVVLILAWYHCRTLCGLLLEDTAHAVHDAGLRPGRDLRLLTVSLDPRDDPATALARRDRVERAYGSALAPDAWRFVVGDADAIRRLASSVGVGYRWDARTRQFAHPTALFVLTPDARLSSRLDGVRPSPAALRTAVRRAAAGALDPAPEEPLLLRCFRYVPALRRYAGAVETFLRVGAAVSLVGAVGLVVRAVRSPRRRRSLR